MRVPVSITVTVVATLLASGSPLAAQQLLKELYIPSAVNRVPPGTVSKRFRNLAL